MGRRLIGVVLLALVHGKCLNTGHHTLSQNNIVALDVLVEVLLLELCYVGRSCDSRSCEQGEDGVPEGRHGLYTVASWQRISAGDRDRANYRAGKK